MEPINYMLDVKNPIEEAMRGYGLGRADIEQRQVMQEREQMMGLRGAAEARAASEFEMRRAEAERQRAQAEAMQAQLAGLRDKALSGALTTDDLNQFALNNASTFGEFQTAFEAMEAPRREADTQFGIQLSTSLLSGKTEVALAMLDERIAAAENAGDTQEAAALRANRQLAEIDPQGQGVATLALLTASGALPPSVMDAIIKETGQGNVTAEGASPLGKIAQDVEAGLIPKSVLDAAIKLDAQTSEGTLTLQQKIAEEARLRGEYAKRTEDLSAAERNFSIIETSAMDQSGAGDIALVTSFMKMLDPGSVVRETEFATAANAGGLLARLTGIAKKVEDGQFLSAQQRADFKRLAGEYLNAAKVQEQGVQQSYQLIVDNYQLDPVNVFGARAATALAPGATSAIPQSFITNQNVTNAATAAGVTPEDMWNVMTPEQRARYGG
jgi:hypothetical protein